MPVQYIQAAIPLASNYNEPYTYGYSVPPPASWQLEQYHSMTDPHLQRMFPVHDNPAYNDLVPPLVVNQRLQPIGYAVMNTDAEYDYDLLLDGHLLRGVPSAECSHFRWRPHRLL
jgi:hypothetical protein